MFQLNQNFYLNLIDHQFLKYQSILKNQMYLKYHLMLIGHQYLRYPMYQLLLKNLTILMNRLYQRYQLFLKNHLMRLTHLIVTIPINQQYHLYP
jgi:hypothetical protein